MSYGMICLAIYLILTALLILTNFTIVYAAVIQGLLALAAGILILLRK